VLRITPDDERWSDARVRLWQVAANYMVAAAAAAEETSARQRETLKAWRKRVKAPPGGKKSHQRAPLSLALKMDIARELNAIELATPGLSAVAKQVRAIDAVIARLDALPREKVSTGLKRAKHIMLDQLVAVARDLHSRTSEGRREHAKARRVVMGLKPKLTHHQRQEAIAHLLISASRKRFWEFINAFMVDAMRMTRPDIEENRSRANKLLPDLRREAQRRKMLKTERAQADAAR
jgi:hypothetical protein